MTETLAAFIAHSPLRFGTQWICEHTEHSCDPATCKRECLEATCSDLERWIKEMGNE